MGLQAKVKEGQLFPSLFSLGPQNQLLKGWGPTEGLQMEVGLPEPLSQQEPLQNRTHDSPRRLGVRAMDPQQAIRSSFKKMFPP